MKGISICKNCQKTFSWTRAKDQMLPKFCSRKCKGMSIHEYIYKNRFLWCSSTEEEKKEHLKKYYEKNVIRKEGCWDWSLRANRKGYIKINPTKKWSVSAHVLSWKIHRGEIPEGILVLHKCHNRRCTNPDHLHLGSHKENMDEMVRDGKQARGESHGQAKLNENDVVKIKYMINLGIPNARIGRKYGVHKSTIWKISKGKCWKHLKVE